MIRTLQILAAVGLLSTTLGCSAKDDKLTVKFPILQDVDCASGLEWGVQKKWTRLRDQYNRPINRLQSPELSYGYLQDFMVFADADVTFVPTAKDGEPHAFIRKPWLSLEITFTNGPRPDGADKSALCRALIIEHKLQALIDQRPADRKYRYPSIMMECDYEDHEKFSLDGRLYMELYGMHQWKEVRTPRGNLEWKFASSKLTYKELQNQINFNDEDVTVNATRKRGEPHAFIRTAWLTCEITYVDKVYDGKDKSVKLRAVVIDNKMQTWVDGGCKEEDYLKFFNTKPGAPTDQKAAPPTGDAPAPLK